MRIAPLFSFFALALLIVSAATLAQAQNPPANAQPSSASGGSSSRSDGIALAPARFELEMSPGSETTVVVNLDYHTTKSDARAYRLVASLNDWSMSRNGELVFYKAGTRPDSASPWIIYSPSEVTAQPGQTHSIRVTISVPKEATPGDHLAALIIEQRPDTIKLNANARQMLMRFRMAAIFYIMVPQLTRKGTLSNLLSLIFRTSAKQHPRPSRMRPSESIRRFTT